MRKRKQHKYKIFCKGDVYWANIPWVQNDKKAKIRPVVIVGNAGINNHSDNTIVVPFTHQIKRLDLSTHRLFNLTGTEDSMCLAESITVLPKSRLYSFIRKLNKRELRALMEAVDAAIGEE